MVKKESNFPYIAIVALVAVVAVVLLILNVGKTSEPDVVNVVDEEGNLVGEAFRLPGGYGYRVQPFNRTFNTSKIRAVSRYQPKPRPIYD